MLRCHRPSWPISCNHQWRPPSYVRFEADLPNECWQSGFTRWRLAGGATTEVITWLDDHSRYALSVTAHRRATGPIVVDTFNKTADHHGYRASVLTDNAMVCTARFSGGRNALETLLGDLGIAQKHSAPNHPTTGAKVERFQQTLKKWLTAQTPADTIDQLQRLLDDFTATYNHRRPHRSLNRQTPAAAYNRLPKTGPAQNGAGTHWRARQDRVDKTGAVTLRHNGKLHHIGIGRPHAGTPNTLLIADLHIRIVNTRTGELLHHLTLNPEHDYQPQNKP